MDNRQWLDSFRGQLDLLSVPTWHRDRIVTEMAQHLEDGGSADLLGNPVELARESAGEFRDRAFLQRHPGIRRLAVPSLLMSLFAGLSLLFAPGSAMAGEFLVSARLVDSKAGITLSAPRIRIASNQEGVVSIQDQQLEFRLTAKAGNDGESTTHSIEFVVTRSGTDGKKEQLCSPRIIVRSDQDASIEIPGLSLHVRVSAVK